MNRIKIIIAAIPLAVSLSGPAAAALVDPSGAGDLNGARINMDSLLNQFSGLTPGDNSSTGTDNLNVLPSRQLSSFTSAGTPMSSYYTVLGGERTFSAQSNSATGRLAGSGADTGNAAAPAARTSAVHLPQESLGAVAAGISPSSSGQAYRAALTPQVIGGPLIPTVEPTPVPLPAALVLLGSGLAALAPLRKRKLSNCAE